MNQRPSADIPVEIVTAKNYIASLLHRMVSECLLVDASLPLSGGQVYTTTLLQLFPADGILLLDDLFPQLPATELVSGIPFALEACFDGVQVKLSTAIESLEEGEGLRMLKVAFPEQVEYRHARNEHRVELSALSIPVTLMVAEGEVLVGQLFDVSNRGISLRLASVSGLKRGKAYRCIIDHSDEERVEIEIKPSRVEKLSGQLPIKLGALLHDMDKQDLWHWQRFVAELERRMLRQ